ncbi:Bardet-Biedl syndrome 1 protein homolog [Zerene cesonia]|uniref:Bardet-Biedl syndrome 1 protein homolog n=1 Tax=Zerene cesonia TaxID=33412 RepID=UPI0018E4E3D3|nr:Bardet-Biedl syndrome 1 protein homolog [Zerene cesonia]
MGAISRWLDVEVGTADININTLPSNIALVDLNNDNEVKLVVGDMGKEQGPQLRIFKGAMQISDFVLPDLPLGVVSFYASETMPKAPPLIAIAFDSCIHIYRHLKFFYKYQLPTVDINENEMEIWKQLKDPVNHNETSLLGLSKSLYSLSHNLCSQSKNFLQMTIDEKLEFVETADPPKKILIHISCITTLKMNSMDKYSVSCLVIGTEEGDVVILDPHTFTQLMKVNINTVKAVPYQIIATGLYNVDYRITVATREKSVCLLKRDWEEGRQLFRTDDHIVAIEVMTFDHSVMVICCDKTLACFSKKGRKQWWLSLEHRPVAMCQVPVLHLGVTLVAVALASGHLHLFDGRVKRDAMFVRDIASVIKFGQLGQEDHVFTIVTASGNLMLKILKRTADFNEHAAGVEPTAVATVGQKPWLIPKKSKLFLEQSMRERENAAAMHQTFQHELDSLRLTAAKTLLEVYAKSDNAMGIGALEPVRLSAEVQGLGPVFRMTLIIENTSKDKAVVGLSVLFHTQGTSYKVNNPYIKIPLLTPGSRLKFPTRVEEIFSENINPDVFFRTVTGQAEGSLVKILLLKEGKSNPILAATVQMPPTDPMMVPFEKIQATSDFNDIAD